MTIKNSLQIIDAHELDNKIPKGLIMNYSGKPFVLKAGLEWKATTLFGIGKWSMETEIVKYEPEKRYALVKARVKVNDSVYEDFGEASPENVPNKLMHKYILLLAVTRAGNRALRRATACGFTSVEELDTEDVKEIFQGKEQLSNGKCPHCGTTGKYHAPACPNNPMKGKSAEPGFAHEPQKKKIFAMAKSQGIDPDIIHDQVVKKFGLESWNDLTKSQASEVIEDLGRAE